MTGHIIQISYFIAAVLFIFGMKGMSSPLGAQKGIVWAGAGMLLATLVTFLDGNIIKNVDHRTVNYILMIIAIAIGGGLAWVSGKKVQMTDMPQMIALYNGMGGGAAAAIAATQLIGGHIQSTTAGTLAVLGALIGSVSFSGSLIAYAKLQGILKGVFSLPKHQWITYSVFAIAVLMGAAIAATSGMFSWIVVLFFVLALLFGVLMTLPIGGADMPVVISLFNALTGLAVAFEGFVLNNAAMIIAGTVVGAAGTLLTQLMAKAMNRSIAKLLSPAPPSVGGAQEVVGSMREIGAQDTAILMAYAQKVIIIPGYGMAVAQAQHKVWELTQLLEEKGIEVKFAIHPVAGRMPGHMNVLLAEAGVNYERIFDLDEINPEFPQADVVLVIGANDVVNPVARTDKSSPIYGMPILNADMAKNVVVIKRGQGSGFSGIENALFYKENTKMFYGGGQEAVNKLIAEVKQL
jgi:H+-translocating NAD(P) transhydrogenase subunit beta